MSEESNICLNCETAYTGSYCNRCGQSRNTPRYRFSNAFRNILGGFTNIDNGFGRTLLDLLYRPGYMIRDFIAGKRILYFRPFQTLFVLAALYIMAVQLVDPEALKEKKENHRKSKDKKYLLHVNNYKTNRGNRRLTHQRCSEPGHKRLEQETGKSGNRGFYGNPEEESDSHTRTLQKQIKRPKNQLKRKF